MKLLTGLHLKPEICGFSRYLLKIIGANRKFLKQPRNDEMVVLIQHNIAVTIGIPYIFIADWCMVCPFSLFAHFFKTAYYIIAYRIRLRSEGNLIQEINLINKASKGKQFGRIIPLHKDWVELLSMQQKNEHFNLMNRIITTERNNKPCPQAIVNFFYNLYKEIGFEA